MMDKRLQNKTALVTGAGSGIGRAIALLFARHGAHIGVNVHESLEKGKKTVRDIEAQGGRALLLPADVSHTDEVKEAVEALVTAFDGIDILVNNSGIGTTHTPDRVTDIDDEEWDRVLAVNLKGAMLTSKFAIPHMQKQGGGSIVNISSIRGLLGNPVLASYCASKGGMVLLTKQMAVEFGKENIRVNCVCPGFTHTEMFETYLRKQHDPEGAMRIFADMAPIGRIGTPEEVAHCALFFASNESSFITGAALPVDGGYTANGIRVIQ
jgi:NAD(P)-dependent dehydrogenase (short-subunit alcohol dehydrogenase family)